MQSSQVIEVDLPSTSGPKVKNKELPPWAKDFKIIPLDFFTTNRSHIIKSTKAYVRELSQWRSTKKSQDLRKLRAVLRRLMMFLHTFATYIDRQMQLESEMEEQLISLVSLYMNFELRYLNSLQRESVKESQPPPTLSNNINNSVDSQTVVRYRQLLINRFSHWIYCLLPSHEQRVDALLSTTFYTKTTRPVLDPIFRKILFEMPHGPFTSVSYVRHMLAFKTWREQCLVFEDDESRALYVYVKRHLNPVDFKAFPESLLRCLGKGSTFREHARPYTVILRDECKYFINFCRTLPAAADHINLESISEGISLLDDDVLYDEENEVSKLMNMISNRKMQRLAASEQQTQETQQQQQKNDVIDLTIFVEPCDVIDLTEDDFKATFRKNMEPEFSVKLDIFSPTPTPPPSTSSTSYLMQDWRNFSAVDGQPLELNPAPPPSPAPPTPSRVHNTFAANDGDGTQHVHETTTENSEMRLFNYLQLNQLVEVEHQAPIQHRTHCPYHVICDNLSRTCDVTCAQTIDENSARFNELVISDVTSIAIDNDADINREHTPKILDKRKCSSDADADDVDVDDVDETINQNLGQNNQEILQICDKLDVVTEIETNGQQEIVEANDCDAIVRENQTNDCDAISQQIVDETVEHIPKNQIYDQVVDETVENIPENLINDQVVEETNDQVVDETIEHIPENQTNNQVVEETIENQTNDQVVDETIENIHENETNDQVVDETVENIHENQTNEETNDQVVEETNDQVVEETNDQVVEETIENIPQNLINDQIVEETIENQTNDQVVGDFQIQHESIVLEVSEVPVHPEFPLETPEATYEEVVEEQTPLLPKKPEEEPSINASENSETTKPIKNQIKRREPSLLIQNVRTNRKRKTTEKKKQIVKRKRISIKSIDEVSNDPTEESTNKENVKTDESKSIVIQKKGRRNQLELLLDCDRKDSIEIDNCQDDLSPIAQRRGRRRIEFNVTSFGTEDVTTKRGRKKSIDLSETIPPIPTTTQVAELTENDDASTSKKIETEPRRLRKPQQPETEVLNVEETTEREKWKKTKQKPEKTKKKDSEFLQNHDENQINIVENLLVVDEKPKSRRKQNIKDTIRDEINNQVEVEKTTKRKQNKNVGKKSRGRPSKNLIKLNCGDDDAPLESRLTVKPPENSFLEEGPSSFTKKSTKIKKIDDARPSSSSSTSSSSSSTYKKKLNKFKFELITEPSPPIKKSILKSPIDSDQPSNNKKTVNFNLVPEEKLIENRLQLYSPSISRRSKHKARATLNIRKKILHNEEPTTSSFTFVRRAELDDHVKSGRIADYVNPAKINVIETSVNNNETHFVYPNPKKIYLRKAQLNVFEMEEPEKPENTNNKRDVPEEDPLKIDDTITPEISEETKIVELSIPDSDEYDMIAEDIPLDLSISEDKTTSAQDERKILFVAAEEIPPATEESVEPLEQQIFTEECAVITEEPPHVFLEEKAAVLHENVTVLEESVEIFEEKSASITEDISVPEATNVLEVTEDVTEAADVPETAEYAPETADVLVSTEDVSATADVLVTPEDIPATADILAAPEYIPEAPDVLVAPEYAPVTVEDVPADADVLVTPEYVPEDPDVLVPAEGVPEVADTLVALEYAPVTVEDIPVDADVLVTPEYVPEAPDVLVPAEGVPEVADTLVAPEDIPADADVLVAPEYVPVTPDVLVSAEDVPVAADILVTAEEIPEATNVSAENVPVAPENIPVPADVLVAPENISMAPDAFVISKNIPVVAEETSNPTSKTSKKSRTKRKNKNIKASSINKQNEEFVVNENTCNNIDIQFGKIDENITIVPCTNQSVAKIFDNHQYESNFDEANSNSALVIDTVNIEQPDALNMVNLVETIKKQEEKQIGNQFFADLVTGITETIDLNFEIVEEFDESDKYTKQYLQFEIEPQKISIPIIVKPVDLLDYITFKSNFGEEFDEVRAKEIHDDDFKSFQDHECKISERIEIHCPLQMNTTNVLSSTTEELATEALPTVCHADESIVFNINKVESEENLILLAKIASEQNKTVNNNNSIRTEIEPKTELHYDVGDAAHVIIQNQQHSSSYNVKVQNNSIIHRPTIKNGTLKFRKNGDSNSIHHLLTELEDVINEADQSEDKKLAAAAAAETNCIVEDVYRIEIQNPAELQLIPDLDDFIIQPKVETLPPIVDALNINKSPPKVDYSKIESLVGEPPKKVEPKKVDKPKKIEKTKKMSPSSLLLEKYKNQMIKNSKTNVAVNKPNSYIRTTRLMRMVTVKKVDVAEQKAETEKKFDELCKQHKEETEKLSKIDVDATVNESFVKEIPVKMNEKLVESMPIIDIHEPSSTKETRTRKRNKIDEENSTIDREIRSRRRNKSEESSTINENIPVAETIDKKTNAEINELPKEKRTRKRNKVDNENSEISSNLSTSNVVDEEILLTPINTEIEIKTRRRNKSIDGENVTISSESSVAEISESSKEKRTRKRNKVDSEISSIVDEEILLTPINTETEIKTRRRNKSTDSDTETSREIKTKNQTNNNENQNITTDPSRKRKFEFVDNKLKTESELLSTSLSTSSTSSSSRRKRIKSEKVFDELVEEYKQTQAKSSTSTSTSNLNKKRENIDVDDKDKVFDLLLEEHKKSLKENESKINKQNSVEESFDLISTQGNISSQNTETFCREKEPTNDKSVNRIEVVQNWIDNRLDTRMDSSDPETIEECTYFNESSNNSMSSPNTGDDQEIKKSEPEKPFEHYQTPDSGISMTNDDDSVQKHRTPDHENPFDTIDTTFIPQETPIITDDASGVLVHIPLVKIQDILPFIKEKMTNNNKRNLDEDDDDDDVDVDVDDQVKRNKLEPINDVPLIDINSEPEPENNPPFISKGAVKAFPSLLSLPDTFSSPYPSEISITEETDYLVEGIDLCNDIPCYESFDSFNEQESFQTNINDMSAKMERKQTLELDYCSADNQFLTLPELMSENDMSVIIGDINVQNSNQRLFPVNMHQVQPDRKRSHSIDETKRNEFEDYEEEPSIRGFVDGICNDEKIFPEQTNNEIQVSLYNQETKEVVLVTNIPNSFLYDDDVPLQIEVLNIPDSSPTTSTSTTDCQVNPVPEVFVDSGPQDNMDLLQNSNNNPLPVQDQHIIIDDKSSNNVIDDPKQTQKERKYEQKNAIATCSSNPSSIQTVNLHSKMNLPQKQEPRSHHHHHQKAPPQKQEFTKPHQHHHRPPDAKHSQDRRNSEPRTSSSSSHHHNHHHHQKQYYPTTHKYFQHFVCPPILEHLNGSSQSHHHNNPHSANRSNSQSDPGYRSASDDSRQHPHQHQHRNVYRSDQLQHLLKQFEAINKKNARKH